MSKQLHDWTLKGFTIDWEEAWIKIQVLGWDEQKEIEEQKEVIIRDFSDINIPRQRPWGPSVSINELYGPEKYGDKEYIFKIEMQTGDIISIIAASIEIT